jgi:hypothetical protein
MIRPQAGDFKQREKTKFFSITDTLAFDNKE